MLRLLLVRHGETTWNAAGRYQGQIDVPLSDVGRQQAAALAQYLAQEKIDVIYASDLQRAAETAQHIAASHSLPVLTDPRLREISFGEWEGLTHAEIRERYSEALDSWLDAPMDNAPPAGETMTQVAERVRPLLDAMIQAHQEQTVLWATHGGLLRILLCLLLDLPLSSHWKLRMDNAALSEVAIYDKGAILNCMNTTYHLRNGNGCVTS